MSSNSRLTLFASLALSTAASIAFAAPASPQPAAPASPAPASPAVTPAEGAPPLSATDQIWLGISEQMGGGEGGAGHGGSPGADPMKIVSAGMADIAEDLGAELTGKPVQIKQAKVVDQLDVLIKSLEKSCKSGGSGPGGANPSSPAADSTLAKGPGGMNELHDPKASEKQWGALKPKEREQILQSTTEGFPQGYESLLQTYYRRLANEETPTPPAGETPAAGPDAAANPAAAAAPAAAGGAGQP